MIASALEHAPACIDYMKLIKDPTVFHFCAVPQLMAMATLDKLYNNHEVFDKEVKIRKGLALKLMNEGAQNMDTVVRHFKELAASIQQKARACGDEKTCRKIEQIAQYLESSEN